MSEKVKGLRIGIIIFLFITVATLALIYALAPNKTGKNNFQELWLAIKQMKPMYLFYSFLFIVAALIVGAYRRQIITRGVDKKLGFWPALSVITSYEFISAITPFGGGGQPLEVWVLKKNGISVGRGSVITYMNTASLTLVLFLLGPLALIIYPELLSGVTVLSFLIYGSIFPIWFITATIIAIYVPKTAKKIAHSILRFAVKVHLLKQEKFAKTLRHTIEEINLFNNFIKAFFSWRKIPLLLYVIFITFIAFSLRWLSLITIVLAIGIKLTGVSITQIILAQMLIMFANYSVPTPGSSGTSELLAYHIFEVMFPQNKAAIIMTLWRFFTFHLIFLLSMIPALKVIHMKDKEEHKQARDIIRA